MQSDKAFLTALKICILYVIILLVSHKSDVIDVASPIIDVDKKEAFTLESEGLIVVDVLDEEQIEVIRSYFLEDQSIDYDNLKKYLLSYVKEKIDGKLSWDVQFNTYLLIRVAIRCGPQRIFCQASKSSIKDVMGVATTGYSLHSRQRRDL